MYSFIIFDADNTLFDFSLSEKYALKQTFYSLGFYGFDEKVHVPLYAEINKEIWKEFEDGKITSESLKAERFRRFLNRLQDGAVSAEPEEISSRYLTYLSQSGFLLPGAFDLVQSLHRSHTLSLLTNGLTSVQKPRIEASGLKNYFSAVLISEEIGTAKPDPEIFSMAMKEMGADDKNDVLMVGDNLNSDIRGGATFGIATCWLNSDGKSGDFSIQPTYEISELEELYAIVFPPRGVS